MFKMQELNVVVSSEGVLGAIASLGIALIVIYYNNNRKPRLPNIPVAQLLADKTPTQCMMIARGMYPNEPFIMPMRDPWVILPHYMVDEVKNMPQSTMSLSALNHDRMFAKYSTFPAHWNPEGLSAIRDDLTRHTPKVLAELQDEGHLVFADYVETKFKSACDTAELPVYATVTQMISRLTARTFVGLPLCRDEEWLQTTINITHFTVDAINAIGSYSPLVRPFVAPFLKQIRRIKALRRVFVGKIKPQLDALIGEYHQRQFSGQGPKPMSKNDEDHAQNHNLLRWTLAHFKDARTIDAERIADFERGVAIVAIHTTSMALTFMIFDLAAYPKYAQELREEISKAKQDRIDGSLSKNCIAKLVKLDSFMKESQRKCPPSLIHMARMVVAKNGVVLSNGVKLPYGTYVGVGAPYHDESTIPKDTLVTSSGQPPLTEFYPWRYSNLRARDGEANRHQFVTTDENEIMFGTGRHACPGRFFASYEMKVLLVELLTRYDLSLDPPFKDGSSASSKPDMIEMDILYVPSPVAKIWLKRR